MAQSTPALKEAMAAIERLSVRQQRELTAHLLKQAASDERTFILCLKRLSRQKQERLAALMERNNEGILDKREREELRHLKDEVDRLVLENSIALVHALRPEMPRKANPLTKGRSRRVPKKNRA
jgi:hypothetical protein